MSKKEKLKLSELDLKERIVEVKRVIKVIKGGRKIGFRVLVVVGNQDGIVGYGLGKAKDPMTARKRGAYKASKNLIRVPLSKTTIPHNTSAEYNASRVLMRPAAGGTGVIAGGGVRVVLECAGVPNVLTKLLGSNNRLHSVKATIKALEQLRTPAMVAKDRGITVDKVFNG